MLAAQQVVTLRREDPYRVVQLADGTEVFLLRGVPPGSVNRRDSRGGLEVAVAEMKSVNNGDGGISFRTVTCKLLASQQMVKVPATAAFATPVGESYIFWMSTGVRGRAIDLETSDLLTNPGPAFARSPPSPLTGGSFAAVVFLDP